jgi:HEAT repeat protein
MPSSPASSVPFSHSVKFSNRASFMPTKKVSNLHMKARLLVPGFSLFCALSATAQLSGTFYFDKTTFAPGEPIFLYLKISNQGKSPKQINTTALPEQPFCAGYEINISRNPPDASSCPNFQFNGCSLDGQFSYKTIQPGGIYIERIFLNFYSELKIPGEYSIDAKHDDIGGWHDDSGRFGDDLKVESTLHLRVDAGAPATSNALFQPWVDQLHSRSRRKQIEAAMVLASLAPPSFEKVLLSFAHDPNLRSFAPLAFHHLNSPRSIAALAALLDGPYTGEQGKAARYLAETGDQRWRPLLLDVGEKNAGDLSFPAAAAELGGDKAIPMLVAAEKSPDRKFAAVNAVMAMGYTGSRAAIPYLLEDLKHPEADLADSANAALQLLTHRTAQAGEQTTPPADYPKWSQWWTREGATAPIYKAPQMSCAPLQLQTLP